MKQLKLLAALIIFIVIMFTSVSCMVVARDDNGRHRGWNRNSDGYMNSDNRNYRDNRGNRGIRDNRDNRNNRNNRQSERNERENSATIVIRSK